MSRLHKLRRWVKDGQSPLARAAKRLWLGFRHAELPVGRGLHRSLYEAHMLIRSGIAWTARVLWWTPLFKSRLKGPATRLYIYGGMPQVLGPLEIDLGADCRVSAQTTLIGRWSGETRPTLEVGRNVDIGWQTTLAVGRRVVLGDNVRIAGRAFLAGFPGHPLDAEARAAGLPETEDQVGDIILERDVWLGTGVTVLAGVTIGAGTVVGAGSLVTRDLPPGVLAGGVPARVIRAITPTSPWEVAQ